MKAIILAAGQGTRLRPFTYSLPKCMVPISGKPLVEHQIEVLNHLGIKDIIIIGGYLAEHLTKRKVSVVVNERYNETNMVHSLFCAEQQLTDEADLIISYGDIVYEDRILENLIQSPESFSLTIDLNWRRYWELRNSNPLLDAETLKLDKTGHILELGKKPKGYEEIQGQYMGLFKITSKLVPQLKKVHNEMDIKGTFDGKDYDNMYMTSFLQHLINIGWKIRSVPVMNGWLEVDTVRDLELYEKMAKDGSLNSFCNIHRLIS